jgi:hypothetical protein
MGLRIMRYRAAVIGATLEIRSRPAAGTMIQCLFTPVFRKVTQTDEAKSGNEGRQPGVETSTYEPAKTI